MKLIKEW